MTSSQRSRLHIASRVAASLLGSYGFVWGFMALGAAAGVRVGLEYEDALQVSSWLGALVFVTSLCASFAVASLVRVWTVLGGGGALMTCAAWLLLRSSH